MTIEAERRQRDRSAVSRAASERHTEALVAAYIHELSSRHDAARETRGGPARHGRNPDLARADGSVAGEELAVLLQ